MVEEKAEAVAELTVQVTAIAADRVRVEVLEDTPRLQSLLKEGNERASKSSCRSGENPSVRSCGDASGKYYYSDHGL